MSHSAFFYGGTQNAIDGYAGLGGGFGALGDVNSDLIANWGDALALASTRPDIFQSQVVDVQGTSPFSDYWNLSNTLEAIQTGRNTAASVAASMNSWAAKLRARMPTATTPVSTSNDTLKTEIQSYYTTYYNRAPDAAGLAYWMQRRIDGMTPAQVQQAFRDSAEYKALHPTTATTTPVTTSAQPASTITLPIVGAVPTSMVLLGAAGIAAYFLLD